MTQYINKAAVVAEIDRLQETTMDENRNFLSSYHEGVFDGLSMLESFLDTLEVKELDLEEEYKNFVMDDPVLNAFDSMGMILARHFYELGLKAQKEK